MINNSKTSRYGAFRKRVKVFGLVQTFITILLVQISLVLGIYILLKARSHPDIKQFIQAIGVAVMTCGLLASFFWRFISKLATEGLLILADISDARFRERFGSQGPKQKIH